MVKPDGNFRDHYRYDEFGKPAPGNSKLSPDGAINLHNTFGYTGEMWDEESKLLYLRARYYEPETGRFLSRDTYEGELENPLSRHLYAYVENNPIRNIDPSGKSTYSVGPPKDPITDINKWFDEDFKYNPKAEATAEDYVNWAKWGVYGQGGYLKPGLMEAPLMYSHYRDGTGTDVFINYDKAIKEESDYRAAIVNLISEAQSWAEKLHASGAGDNFKMTGTPYPVRNGSHSENWQKTLGAHWVWASADITFKKGTYSMTITLHVKDRWNFNKGMHDIATGLPDDSNGRFAVLGWAKSFFTYGKAVRKITWTAGKINKSTKIVYGPRG